MEWLGCGKCHSDRSSRIGQQVSIWFGAVVRADNCKIRLGDFTNIQENAVLHTDAGIEMNIGNYVTIGHQAMLHGCTVGDNQSDWD